MRAQVNEALGHTYSPSSGGVTPLVIQSPWAMAKRWHQQFPVFAVDHSWASWKTFDFWSNALNSKFQPPPLAIPWVQLPVAEPAAATEAWPTQLCWWSCLVFAFTHVVSPQVILLQWIKQQDKMRNFQGSCHDQFWCCFSIAIILRATELEGRQQLAPLRFAHTTVSG